MVIPEGVTSIGLYAFGCYDKLTSITLPNNVIYICDMAFVICASLKCINIPNKVTSIGDYTFTDYRKLTSVTIPKGVTFIRKGAFSNCKKISFY